MFGQRCAQQLRGMTCEFVLQCDAVPKPLCDKTVMPMIIVWTSAVNDGDFFWLDSCDQR